MEQQQRWSNPVLTGDLVRLVGVDSSHAPGMWDMVNDPVGAELTATTATFAREQINQWCATRSDQDDRIDLAIVAIATDEFVGEIVLNDFDPVNDVSGFRISLRSPACYGRGFGTQATELLIEHAFEVMKLAGLRLEVLASNDRAIHMYSKVGFAPIRRFTESGSKWIEMELLAIDRPLPDTGLD